MLFITLLILLIFSLFGLLTSRSFLSPTLISPLSWFLILFLYQNLNHGLYHLSDEVLFIIVVWNFFLLLGMYLASNYYTLVTVNKYSPFPQFSSKLLTIYYRLTIIGFLPTIYIIYKQVQSISGDFFYSLRMANTGFVKTDIELGIFQYTITFAYVSLNLELINWKKGESKKRIIVLIIINLIFALITMAKSSIIFLIIPIVIIYLIKNGKFAPNMKVIKYILLSFLLMISIQFLRDRNSTTVQTDSNLLNTYLLGGIPALDIIINSDMESNEFGQHTFAFFNNIQKKIGILEESNKKYKNDITDDGYLSVPNLTNVYTVIGPIWLDFRFYGITIISFMVGFVSAYYYNKSLQKSWALVVYAYLFCVLSLQFFGEYIFTNLSLLIQLIILSYIPYKFRNLNIRWGR